jgi:formylglycine-generating enzyme required for sulfatase activity
MLPATFTAFDAAFWLMVALVAALAYSIESGIAARHKRIVVSSMVVSVATAVLMMFVVDDETTFQHEIATPKSTGKKSKKTIVAMNKSGDGAMEDIEVIRMPGSNGGPGELPTATSRLGTASEIGDPESRSGKGDKGTIDAASKLCRDCPPVEIIDRGSWFIGSNLMETGRHLSEGPVREVFIPRPFGVGVTEVTVSQYRKFVEATQHESKAVCIGGPDDGPKLTWENPGFEQGDDHPVVCVSYADAKAYVLWLSEISKRRYRLLSQAEWEYVARAKTDTAYSTGPEITHEQAAFGKHTKGTVKVDAFEPNPFKLHGVHGNVWEITDDCWAPNLDLIAKDGAPVGIAGDCSRRVIKGGGWDSSVDKLRSASRAVLPEGTASRAVGFRIALTIGGSAGLSEAPAPVENLPDIAKE